MSKPSVVVVGAGPGGLAAARHLARSSQVNVTLVQRGGLATYLPGILPVLLGLRPIAVYRHAIEMPQIQVLPGEVGGLETGSVQLVDGTVLNADAVIAAPGLVTDSAAIPVGPRSFAVWELEAAQVAGQAVQSLTSGRVAVVITSLPYRCPPAPYGLAIALKALFQEQGRAIEVVLVTPEARPLQSLSPRAADFLESLVSTGNVVLQSAFQLDHAACRDGLMVAMDGKRIPYDVGLFIPPHRRPAFLAELPGNGPLVQVDAHLRTAMDKTWVVGDVAATPLPRAAGVAEAQGHTAAESVLAELGLSEPQAPSVPAPNCYVWTSLSSVARIQLRFPNGLPPAGTPELILDPPSAAIYTEALGAPEQWLRQLE
ncbi:MAG: FAD/NAD(P)-binding oxidoreductase [Ktedonobacteraceae bacterium]